ncbi:AAA family ATPase [Devosia neptuniae]|uniref:AAA family ATPase n=1 Tax=Devosia neptuniae TaxID=191302 RepID=A0ABY6CEA8_9HYPH|nr:AAA family ATPase [Devosia neptuniae]UXN70582.1 AAA family ATPase [Devosia neptuniae]
MTSYTQLEPEDWSAQLARIDWTGGRARAASLVKAQPKAPVPPRHGTPLLPHTPIAANDNDAVFLEPSEWQGLPVPTRQWFVEGLIPSRTVTILSGDGGLGKSLLALQLGVASAIGESTMGLTPASGRVLYVGAEDEVDEFHRRLFDIIKSHDTCFDALRDNFLLLPLAERDATLAAPDIRSKMQPTALMHQLRDRMDIFRPGLLVLDTSADLFGGDEIKRSQVRQFVAMLRAIAIQVDCAVLLLSHPSVSGMQSGSGTSGSTAWNNSVRSRLYLTAPNGEDADPDARVLTSMKSNYGRAGDALKLRWQDGIFIVDDGSTNANPALGILNKSDERAFLTMLSKFNQQGQRVGASTGTSYAPAKMAKHPDAKGTTKQRLERAMQRLLEASEIQLVWDGPPSRQRQRLVVTAENFSADQAASTA